LEDGEEGDDPGLEGELPGGAGGEQCGLLLGVSGEEELGAGVEGMKGVAPESGGVGL
jgi:hypothetical protein